MYPKLTQNSEYSSKKLIEYAPIHDLYFRLTKVLNGRLSRNIVKLKLTSCLR